MDLTPYSPTRHEPLILFIKEHFHSLGIHFSDASCMAGSLGLHVDVSVDFGLIPAAT